MGEITGSPSTPQHQASMKRFAEALGLEKLDYTDLGKGEEYRLHLKDGRTIFNLKINGGGIDGGFMNIIDISGLDENRNQYDEMSWGNESGFIP